MNPAPQRRAAPAGGLTLIELLVAIAIIAVLYGAIVVSVGAVGGARMVEREATRFAALVSVACERAQATGRDHGVHPSLNAYAFSIASADGWKLETEGDLRPRKLPSGMTLAFAREGSDLELDEGFSEEPQAACFASGELTPFTARVEAGSQVTPQVVEGALDGTLATSPLAGRP